MKKSLSIVIPNYNGRELLEKNLPSVFIAAKASQCLFEVIISDDCSTDSSIAFIKETYPSIILVENKFNQGFSGNINSGIRKAKNDLVLLLNSDIVLTENYIQPLLPYFEIENTFGVMGRIIAIDSDEVQDTAKYPSFNIFSGLKGTINYVVIPQDNQIAGGKNLSLFLSGANALVDREKLLEIGMFQKLFNPFYWEDVELGIKAWRMNYHCYYEDSAICRHPASTTIGKYHKKSKVSIISRRNKILFHYLHLQNLSLFLWMMNYLIKSFFRALSFDISYYKSFYLFLKQKRAASKEKETFQSLQDKRGISIRLQDVILQLKTEIGNTPIIKF